MRRALLVLSLALLAACGKRPEPASDAPPPATAAAGPALQVLATSDLKDIEPLAGQIKAATGVDVQFRFGGTMESTQEVLSGDSAGKPAPDVFLRAAELLGVTPAKCCVIEDSAAGVTAARAAGMTAIAITNTLPAEKLTHAHHEVRTYAEIERLLA